MWTGIGGELVFYNDVFYNDRVEIYGEKNNFQGCDGDPKNCIFDNPFFRKETQKRWKNYDWKRRKDLIRKFKNEHGG